MSTSFTAILEALAFPPGNALVLGVVSLLLRGGRRSVVLCTAFVLLYVQSTPATVDVLTASLERYRPLELDHLPAADAIVVLTAGRYPDAAEYGQDSASGPSLERLQYAVDLERASGLPLVVSGGSVQGEPEAEAAILARVLRGTFGIDNEVLTETRSRSTAENALFTKELLDAHGWHRVLLVTHARHMPRSVAMFQKAGVEVIPAPLRFETKAGGAPLLLDDWLPQAKAMQRFREVAHEYVGMLWYWIRY